MEEKKEKEDEKPSESGQKEKEVQKKITVQLDPTKIPMFVPEEQKNKISKANEEFSFTLNLSND